MKNTFKKTLCLLVCVIQMFAFLLFSTSCSNILNTKNNEENNIIVNGKKTISKNTLTAKNDGGKLKVSLMDVLIALDFSIVLNDNTVKITKGNNEYFLNFSDKTLKKFGSDVNLLYQKENIPSGLEDYHEFIENDVLVGMWTLEALLENMNTPIYVRCFSNHPNDVHILQKLGEEEKKNYNVVINANHYRYDGIYVDNGQDEIKTMIPILPLLEDLGYNVTSNGEAAFVKIGLKRYKIILKQAEISLLGQEIEAYLAGENVSKENHCTYKDGELFISDAYLSGLLDRMGIQCYLFAESGIVYVITP